MKMRNFLKLRGMDMSYRTHQRLALLGFLENNPERQYTIDEMIEQLGEDAPAKSTAYRIVKKLCDEGFIRRFSREGTAGAVYQLAGKCCCAEHLHIRCLECALIMAPSLILCGCGAAEPEPETDDAKLQIVCSSFPAYDFARAVAGDRAQITLLLKPGAEVHSYEPSPKDIIRIQESDLFICNGGESEEWVESLISENEGLNVIYMMDCVDAVEESDEGIYSSDHDEHEHEEAELDEHVWTSPLNAVKIVEKISDALYEMDNANGREYLTNCEVYKAKLLDLDIRIRTTVLQAKRNSLVFADRFPMRYFALEYGLDCFAAFPGCASETEPSAKTVAFLIDRVREEDIPAVLYMEFSNEKMADVICEDTGCKKLPFYSAHSVTAEQFEAGMTYIDLMEINLNTLKEALN